MDWMKHVSVKFKIAIMVVVAAVALAFVSYNGYRSLQRADQGMQQLAAESMQSLEYLGEARVSTRLLQVRAIQGIADPARTESIVKEIPKDMQSYEIALARAAGRDRGSYVLRPGMQSRLSGSTPYTGRIF